MRALSTMAAIGGAAMLVSPLIGGATIELFGWRATLAALAVVTVAMLALAVTTVPESLPVGERHSGGLPQTLRRFAVFLRDRVMVGFVLAFAFAFAAKMAYIAASSFVVQVVLGAGPLGYAAAFAASAAAYIGGTTLNARIAPRVGPGRMLLAGFALSATGGVLLAGATLLGLLSLPLFVGGAVLITVGGGFVEPNASALALARAEGARGTGSALLGSTQFLFGAAVPPLVGLAGAESALPMTVSIVVCIGLAAGAAASAALSGRAASG